MRVCIPSNGADVDHDTVCGHFGSAPYFTLVDTETESVEVIENLNAHHSHGQCHPMTQLEEYHLDGLVCAGLGRRAADSLRQQGITVYRAKGKTISDAVQLVRENKLTAVNPEDIGCGQGEHRMTFHHGTDDDSDRSRPRGNRPRRGGGAGIGRGQGRRRTGGGGSGHGGGRGR